MKTADVIAYFGSRIKVAEVLGITRQAVHEWGATVPQLRAYELERLTDGALRVEDAPTPVQPPTGAENRPQSDPAAPDEAA